MSEESGLMLEIAPQRTSLVLLLRRAQIVYISSDLSISEASRDLPV